MLRAYLVALAATQAVALSAVPARWAAAPARWSGPGFRPTPAAPAAVLAEPVQATPAQQAAPLARPAIYRERRGQLDELDAPAMLAQQAFPLSADALVGVAKSFIETGYGKDDPSLLATEFEMVAPVVQLDRGGYLAAMGGSMAPQDGFPDLSGRQFGFSADPIEPGRVWWVSRPTGTFTQPFFGAEPTGATVETPPQSLGVVIDAEGKVSKFNMGYSMDRSAGNTGGLGGFFGFLWFVGKPLPVPECRPYKPSKRFRLLSAMGALAARVRK